MRIKQDNGEILDVQCQQYEVGLYVCVYKDGIMQDQFCLDITKKQFIEDVKNNKVFEGKYIE